MTIMTTVDFLLLNGTSLLKILAVVAVGLILSIEMIHWATRQRRRRIVAELLDSFRSGWRRGWRGYLALLNRGPWQAAWGVWRAPAGSWERAAVAWFAAMDALIDQRR